MSLDICKPEMSLFLASLTNASHKKFLFPDSVEKAWDNPVIQKYYARKPQHDQLSLLQWLRLVNETSPILSEYPQEKIVLLGLKHVSLFNPVYFFQYMLSFLPHGAMDVILPNATDIPPQILYFNKAVQLMPDIFGDPFQFKSTLENEGHKRYIIETAFSYLESLLALNNMYRRQLLPISLTTSQAFSFHQSVQL